ncbi:MAG: sugar transferase [Planctomycetota bacterium]|jgi:lipopolysaccharide/colanic/teichoic acid biosynthesis glycosyltransferase
MKRLVDIIVSFIAMVVLCVPLCIIALILRLESAGSPIFRQRRVGRRGKPFTMLKFRTMRTDAAPYGQSPHAADDPRLTRFGRWLREKSLDELPQLLNVLAGRMSLVGPRPLYERQAAKWNDRQRKRLEVRPGLTGYAQAYGRGSHSHEEKIEMDVFYVENRGFWFDVKIVSKTFLAMFAGRGEDIYEQRYSADEEFESHQS